MRLDDGVDINRLKSFSGDNLSINIKRLREMGMVNADAGMLRVTAKGKPVLNAVLRDLLDS
jgi:coproporphyrinogen III oxidase-like Fe-S oxidoreductase